MLPYGRQSIDEDDVAGNHGATIGSVSPEQLAYLADRGLSREDAEQLFVRALYEEALMNAPCDAARAVVEAGAVQKGQALLHAAFARRRASLEGRRACPAALFVRRRER